MERCHKQIIIISIYFLLFILLIVFLYFKFKTKETCFDGIKNQNEEEIDCGGACAKQCEKITAQELIVEKTGTVFSGVAGKYDFYAQIANPNAVFGSKKFDYAINFKDSSGNILTSRNGSGFILPGERKYIVENGLDAPDSQISADFKIINSEWVQLTEYYERPDLKIINKNYSEISGGTDFAEARGLLKNNSPYDFETIKIQVILKDENGGILALNSTQMKTVKAGEERDFRAFWPSRFPGAASNMVVQAEVNVFDSDAFSKNFYPSYQFQQY